MNKKLSTLALSALLFTGCTSSKPSDLLNPEFYQGLFTNRPTVDEPFSAILKLQNQALLETAERNENGELIIDEQLLKAIEAEQDATVAELQALSKDIKVLIRYKLVLNGLAIWAPSEVFEKIKSLPNVTLTEKSVGFARPKAATVSQKAILNDKTSVNFIGAQEAYKQNLHGEGMKVGIIDTGIDYTHKMFNGEGTEEAYKAIDPSQPSASFPNDKVVGGIDIVGSKYNSGSENLEDRVPHPDANPLDEAGHGTHVAGTVAGHGDGINTYDGVAPEAKLYAIKVFGANGSTSDEVVIAGLEYAMDPNGDLSFDDQLDVVNLSLGSNYGSAHIMYNHAIRNTVKGGIVVVASGGNSGDKAYVVGAPGVSDEALSVASSVDNSDLNIKFAAAEFKFAAESLQTDIIEGAVSKPLAEVTDAQGELIYLGFADADFDEALKDQIKGKVAFIDRGKVAFTEKIKRAFEAGAKAVVVANNADGDAFVMGGEGKFDIPAVMITKAAGAQIKENLKLGAVVADLKPAFKIEKPWLIDTISDFSSRGPRSEDGVIKPEISAPGSNIISASIGGGAKGEAMSGTSMAGPHIAGVMALLKQKFKDLNPLELKSIAMGHTKLIQDEKKQQYTVSRQGAGRVQIGASLDAKVLSLPASLSFGLTDIEKQKVLKKDLTLKNISTEELTLKPVWKGAEGLQVTVPAVTLAAGESKRITVTAKVIAAHMKQANDELDGYLTFENDKGIALQIPALVVARQISQVSAKEVVVKSSSAADAAGSAAELEIHNKGINAGSAYLFNLLALDARKKDPKPDPSHNRNCDLQSAGYRVIEKDGAKVLQVALKLYEGLTTWNSCEVNVQIDADGDNVTDQELAGLTQDSLPGLTGETFVSLLLDGAKTRELRKKFEQDTKALEEKVVENYAEAVIDQRKMHVFDNSTLAIIEADISYLAATDTGELNLKVSTTHQVGGAIEYDDYLAKNEKKWTNVSTSPLGQAFDGIPEVISLKGNETVKVDLQKGYGKNKLVLYAPQNMSVRDAVLEDTQSQIIPVVYKAE